MSLWRHPERRQLQPLRFNSLGKSEENLCRFAAADAVGEAGIAIASITRPSRSFMPTLVRLLIRQCKADLICLSLWERIFLSR